MTLASGGGGESDVPACGPPASFSVHLASSAVTPAGSGHKSMGDNVVRKALTATGWGKQKETLMATYKAVMRPDSFLDSLCRWQFQISVYCA